MSEVGENFRADAKFYYASALKLSPTFDIFYGKYDIFFKINFGSITDKR